MSSECRRHTRPLSSGVSLLEEPALPPAAHHLREMPRTDKLLPFIDWTEERQRQRGRERRGRRERTRTGGEEKRRQADITTSCLYMMSLQFPESCIYMPPGTLTQAYIPPNISTCSRVCVYIAEDPRDGLSVQGKLLHGATSQAQLKNF